ncbi:phage tail protein [Edwardsiella tarda]|uniref:phage tail protein n=1 Tax=Edwardsiella tarda TaxID=636 RepID=UPI003F65E673
MYYKELLLKPNNSPVTIKAFGQHVTIRRLTAMELMEYNRSIDAEKGNAQVLAEIGIKLFLSALVNPDGSKPSPKDLPTATQILNCQAQADILQAVTDVQRHSYGTLEEAKKN